MSAKSAAKEAMLAAQVRAKGPTLSRLDQFRRNVDEFEGQAPSDCRGPTFRGYILDDRSEERATIRVDAIQRYRGFSAADRQHFLAREAAEAEHLRLYRERHG